MKSLVLALVICVTACGVADFDVSQPVPEQKIDGAPLGGLLGGFFQFPLMLNIQADIQSMHTGPIDSVTLSSLVLDTKADAAQSCAAGATWSFVTSVDLYIESTKSGTTLQKMKLATASMPGDTTHLSFTPTSPKVNLIGYVNEGSQITAMASGTAPSMNVCFDGKATFLVHPL